jgi:hypothetical protein
MTTINALCTFDRLLEDKRYRTVSDIFPGADGSQNLKRLRITLNCLRVGKEKKQLLHKKTDKAIRTPVILCGEFDYLSVVSQCKENNALIDHRFACRNAYGDGEIHFFIQIKHSQLGTHTVISKEALAEWYDECLEALADFNELVLVLVTNRQVEWESAFHAQFPYLLVICKDTLTEFAGLFGERGLLV